MRLGGSVKVYAVIGVPPEVQAYAMAKYSRSSQSMLESIGELSLQRAEQFLNTFYFQYGHRSIADLAHLVMGVEHVSILAAIKVVDEQLWDGQERSTRYQPFKKTGYYTPPGLTGAARETYTRAADALFAAYDDLTTRLLALLVQEVERPADLDPKAFERTLRARAFDVSRSVLPLATITSLGQVVSARVLERQISRLLSDPLAEVREIGEELRAACLRPAEQPLSAEARALAGTRAHGNGNGSGAANGSAGHDPHQTADLEVRAAPTLVKYTAPSSYQIETARLMASLARDLLAPLGEPDRSMAVELGDAVSAEDEIVATLLYRYDEAGHSYRQIQARVRELSPEQKSLAIAASAEHRGRHDDLPRELQSGYGYAFDLLMDVGSFRDLHRHRRCVQIVQEPTAAHGAEPAAEVFPRAFGSKIGAAALAAGLGAAYDRALDIGLQAARDLEADELLAAPYLLPMATRIRALFKMDAAQAVYISELRTGEGGHFSYRRIAWEMYEVLQAHSPAVAALARPTPILDPPDLLRR
ncbi:MAG: FAD-dependent thymidylate synthase [Chloroflexi bacterium]|nr:FAD-dependent thymidylate synthase [Chloroflexota bacterium]